MDVQERDRLYRSALESYRARRYEEASRKLARLTATGTRDPKHLSLYGMTLVRDSRTRREGIELCQRAIGWGCRDPVVYLNLSRAYFAMGSRLRAIQVLRQGLRSSVGNAELLREIERLSPRGKPVLALFHRDHVLNKYLGRVRARLGGGR